MTEDAKFPEPTLRSLQPVVVLTRRGLVPYNPARDVVLIEQRSGGDQLVLSTKERGHTVLIEGPRKRVADALFHIYDRIHHGFVVISLRDYDEIVDATTTKDKPLWG